MSNNSLRQCVSTGIPVDMGNLGEIRTAKELGKQDAPPDARYIYAEYVIQDGVDEQTGMLRWMTKRSWIPVDKAA